MRQTVTASIEDIRLSRRTAVGHLAGAGALAAIAATHFGNRPAAAHGSVSSIRSSVITVQEGTPMTDATPATDNAPLTVVLVHGAFADASGWTGVIERLQAAGIATTAPPNLLRGVTHDSAYIVSYLNQIPGPVLLIGHSYGGAVITNAGSQAKNVVGLVYVAGLAPDEGETLLALEEGSRDSVVFTALIPYQYPSGNGTETATEFVIDPARLQEVFAADLSESQAAVLAATQRPISEVTFAEPTTAPAWKSLPTWAVVATGDKTLGTDVVRFCAERAGATIVEVEGSHVVMISQPQAVTDVILSAVEAVSTVAVGA
jgi:pimeloyl-ACP methyl ester carboxylesterase